MPPPPTPKQTPDRQVSQQAPVAQHLYTAPAVLASRPPSQAPSDPLEQRILDLLYPYRDECFADENETTEIKERNALILCGM
jgi:hypothetical protein